MQTGKSLKNFLDDLTKKFVGMSSQCYGILRMRILIESLYQIICIIASDQRFQVMIENVVHNPNPQGW